MTPEEKMGATQRIDSLFLSTAKQIAEKHGMEIDWDRTNFAERRLEFRGPDKNIPALVKDLDDAFGDYIE